VPLAFCKRLILPCRILIEKNFVSFIINLATFKFSNPIPFGYSYLATAPVFVFVFVIVPFKLSCKAASFYFFVGFLNSSFISF